MQRIDGPSAAAARPAPAPVSGTPGYFTGGDPAVPTAPTAVSADWLNAIQEEVMGVILGAGLTPSKADSAQLLAAIRALITSGGVSFASDAETVAGALANKAVSPRGAAALVSDRVAGVRGGVAAALDTLAKIAAAIGNNPNLAADTTAALAARALAARRISATGAATGGGTLTDDLVIDVAAASGAEINAGSALDRVLTPAGFASAGGGDGSSGWAPLPGGNIIQWGSQTVIGTGSSLVGFNIAFPRPFLNVCGSLVATCNYFTAGKPALVVNIQSTTIAGASGTLNTTDSDNRFSNGRLVQWQAIGR